MNRRTWITCAAGASLFTTGGSCPTRNDRIRETTMRGVRVRVMYIVIEDDEGFKSYEKVTAYSQNRGPEWAELPTATARRFAADAETQDWPDVSSAPSGQGRSREVRLATQSVPSRVYVASNAVDNLIGIYRVGADGKLSDEVRLNFTNTVYDVVAAPGGREVYAAVAVSRGTEIHVINGGTNRVARSFPTGQNSELIALAVAPDGGTLYAVDRAYQTTGVQRSLVLIDPAAGTVRKRIALPGNGSPEDVVASPNGELVYVTSLQGVQIFDVLTESWAWTISNGVRLNDTSFSIQTQGIRITPNGRYLVARGSRLSQGTLVGAVIFVDTATALAVGAVELPDRSMVKDLEVDPEDGTVAVAGAQTVYVIDPMTRSIVQRIPTPAKLKGVSFARIPLA